MDSLENVLGVIIFLYLIFLVYKLTKKEKDIVKKLDEISYNDPSQRQNIRIIKSRSSSRAELGKFDKNQPIIIVIIMIIIGAICITYALKSNDMDKYILVVFLSLSILFLYYGLIKIKGKITKKNIKKVIKNYLEIRYGHIDILPTPSKEIVEGKKTEEGNVRNVYLFSYKIEKYNCILTGYYQEELVRNYSPRIDNNFYGYKYKTRGFFLNYVYDIENIDLNVLNESHRTISELEKARIMNVKAENNCLSIDKETVLFGYNKKDADFDTNDIKVFYDNLIKEIEVK